MRRPCCGAWSQVMKDYEGKDPGVISMKAGEVCDLIKPEANGWNLVKTSAGAVGFFPAAFVKPKNDVDAEKVHARSCSDRMLVCLC